ncbi:hypothetical protein [Candidatus Mycobacterium methanotrophicum]|uniref:Uncharacterized protein n=1 Tax=Candidatus Mycobacterium methanotrophicum TaxID=2943498 RepID=A0ABY4QS52_9MYCO|nr:hypothetical protein [Candidatus Mycobacterium methanotrophicum]UQX13504.1 hypothetical protein M5I08_25250 [Candidatus Mycobacterium methanotrophicum]
MTIYDQSNAHDVHRGTLRAHEIVRNVLAAESFWDGDQMGANPSEKEDRCLS